MEGDVVIDIPMDAEEVVRCLNFEDKRYLNLRFGSDQIGLQFNNNISADNNNNTNNIPTPNTPPQDKRESEEDNNNINKENTNTNTNNNNNNNNTNTNTNNNNNKQVLLYSPTNSPIMRHKIEANRSYARRIPTNRQANSPFIGAARRLHRQAVENSQHQFEMERLTNDFKSKIKVNRKKKIEMKTFKRAVMDLDM